MIRDSAFPHPQRQSFTDAPSFHRATLDRHLAYAKLELDPMFDEDAFVTVIASLAGLKLRPGDKLEIGASWKSFDPLPESLARIGVEDAVRLHGRGRHVRIYLTAVRTLVVAHWRGPTHKETR